MFTYKSNILKVALYTVVLAVIVQCEFQLIPSVHAQASVGFGAKMPGSLGDDLVSFVGKLALVNTFMHVMLLIALQFVGYLLQADFFNDPNMMESLNSIWVLSRDIMNIIFALMLIGVSFYVIITGKTDKAKEKIVNFVVAVVLVNFSWFFPRVVLDIANILTATVYNIPNLLPSPTCKMLDENNLPVDCRVITKILIFPSAAEETAFCPGGPITSGTGIWCKCLDNIECHQSDTYERAKNTMVSSHAMINGLAVSFARISLLAQIPTSTTIPPGGGPVGLNGKAAVGVSFQIAMSIMLAFAIQLAMILPLLGLAVGLFIRIIILWITTAFMPFSFLGYVINGKLGTNVFEFETDIWKEFINAAFLPAMVGIPIAIGFIMLSAVAAVPAPGMSNFTISVPILAGVKTWWQLLWMMAAVGIIWTGAFAALSKSKIIEKFTDKIKGFGESVFGGISQLPLLVPIPLSGGAKSGVNLGTVVHGPKILADSIRLAASGTSGKGLSAILGERFTSVAGTANPDTLAQTLKNDADANTKKVVDAIAALKGVGGGDSQPHINEIKQAIGQDNMKNIDALTLLRQTMERLPAASKLANSDSIKVISDLIAKETPDTNP